MDESILDVVYETAKGLNNAGVMDTKTMYEIESLCLPPVKTYTPEEIKNIRVKNEVSQVVFAAYLNISPSTVQKWEWGRAKPRGPSLKLLNLVEQKGLSILA